MDKAVLKKRFGNWKSLAREIARESRAFPDLPVEIPREAWPENVKNHTGPLVPIKAFRSRRFFIQVVREPNGAERISVNKTAIKENFDYEDGITWDELFQIKNAIGYADRDCIEIYPAEGQLVNVANIRHLFVLDEAHPFNWRAPRKLGIE